MKKSEDDLSDGALMVWMLMMLIPAMLMRAWAIVKLWTWFIAPYYGVRAPDYVTAIGISILIGLVVYRMDHAKDPRSNYEKLGSSVMGVLINAPLTVAIGWLVLKVMS